MPYITKSNLTINSAVTILVTINILIRSNFWVI